MAGTISQIYIQIVFAVKNRQSLISISFEEKLHKFITGIVQNRGNKLLAIGGMPDHIHIFIGLKTEENISALVREIKKSSNAFINENNLCPHKFDWQEGYGAFSYSRSHRDAVCRYVLNQKNHHAKRTFEKEYLKMLADFEVEIGRKKIFDFFLTDGY